MTGITRKNVSVSYPEKLPNDLWQHVLRGLGGIIKIIERNATHDLPMRSEDCKELSRLSEMLDALAVALIRKWQR